MSNKSLLTTAQSAEALGTSKAFLERDRWKGASIPYVKIGRMVRYRPSDIDAVLESCTKFGYCLELGGPKYVSASQNSKQAKNDATGSGGALRPEALAPAEASGDA